MRNPEDPIAAAREAALKALGERDLTRSELLDALIARHDPESAEAAILELETVGIVDDRRVALQYVKRRMEEERPARAALEIELRDRGVDEGLARSVLHEAMAGHDEEEEALELARDRVRRSRPDLSPEVIRRRVFAFLARRGYDEETARQAVDKAAEEYLGRP
jgi:regulatory protein